MCREGPSNLAPKQSFTGGDSEMERERASEIEVRGRSFSR